MVGALLTSSAVFAASLVAENSFAQEVHASTSRLKAASRPTLPHCVNDPSALARIDETRKQNAKNDFKYRAIAETLQSDSDLELVARLIYSETLAANCDEFTVDVVPTIATVIQNRVAKRKGNVKSVIFQRDQFASSLNGYNESKWREFMCPTDQKLWAAAFSAANASDQKLGPMKATAYNYYLYQHSSRFQTPAWAKEPLGFKQSKKIAACLRIFSTEFK
ncbi:hypothetical protein BH10BDE1_BH10BDE1_28870 [soil metagenome]